MKLKTLLSVVLVAGAAPAFAQNELVLGYLTAETEALHQALEAIAARGVTLVVVEHDMQFVGRLCQRVVVLNFGVKIAECPVADIHGDRRVREAYLGTDELAA